MCIDKNRKKDRKLKTLYTCIIYKSQLEHAKCANGWSYKIAVVYITRALCASESYNFLILFIVGNSQG